VAVLRTCAGAAALAVAVVVQAAITPGDRLPDFHVALLHGDPITRRDVERKVVVIDFWASWCLPCREVLPRLDALAHRLAGKAVVVLAVGIDRDRATAERFAATYLPDPALALAHDPSGGLMARLGAPGMPALYVVDCAGVVRQVESGFDASALDAVAARVDALLDGPCGR
jgi:thiol-disulfide isomerase/thioredoxin